MLHLCASLCGCGLQDGPWNCNMPGSGCSCLEPCQGCSGPTCTCGSSGFWQDPADPDKCMGATSKPSADFDTNCSFGLVLQAWLFLEHTSPGALPIMSSRNQQAICMLSTLLFVTGKNCRQSCLPYVAAGCCLLTACCVCIIGCMRCMRH